ncbi:ATP-binding protein, partial [Streptomyces sp. B6B3]|uniref:ATP-binding protein n=1 Tax=Streptomyces sp. B6B3 TaxID=3153570 RepID=UPI00325F7537
MARARHRIVSVVRDWRLGLSDDRLDELRLLVSEVVTNALVHAGGGCRIGVRWTGTRVRVEVTDSTTDLPHRGRATREQESGRGLLLVDTLAPAWGAHARGAGKTVWFEVAPDEPDPDPDPAQPPTTEP